MTVPPTLIPDPSRRLRLATPDELGYPQPSSVGPMQSEHDPSSQQHLYQNMQPGNTEPNTLQDIPIPTSSTSNYYSVPPGANDDSSLPTTTSNIPVYATVRKPHTSSPSLPQHSATLASARQRTISGSPFSAAPTAGGLDLLTSQALFMQSPPTSSLPDPVATLTIRVKHLESLCGKLTREKTDMEEDFGRQRKSFMNQMAHSDAQLTLCKQRVEKYSKEVQELSMQLLTKDEELQNITIAAGITEASLREGFDTDRVKYEEEIASLRKIVSGIWSM